MDEYKRITEEEFEEGSDNFNGLCQKISTVFASGGEEEERNYFTKLSSLIISSTKKGEILSRRKLGKSEKTKRLRGKEKAGGNYQVRARKSAEILRKKENIRKKKLHGRRERANKSGTENGLSRKKESFENTLRDLGGEDNINIFDVAADYTIHFSPSLGSDLTKEQRNLAISKGHGELELDDKTLSVISDLSLGT